MLLGANLTLPEESDAERQARLAQQNYQRLQSILQEISGHLGHWTDAKVVQSLEGLASGARYEPAMRCGEAVQDLRKILVPSAAEGGNEEVARLMDGSGVVQKHLAPLFVSLSMRNSKILLQLMEMFAVLLDEQRKWEYATDHLHQRQVLKKLLGHSKVQHQILTICVHALSKMQAGQEQQTILAKSFHLVKLILAVPEPQEGFKTANGLRQGELGRSVQAIRAMKETRLVEFLMTAASGVEQEPFRKHALVLAEIFSLIFAAFPPVSSSKHSSFNDAKPTKSIRHSNFSGSIVFKLSTGQDYVLRQGTHFSQALDLDAGKREKRLGGRKRTLITFAPFGSAQLASSDVQLGRDIAMDFLASCFNVLFRHLGAEELPDRLNDDRFLRVFMRLASWFLQHAVSSDIEMKSVYAVLDVEVLLMVSRQLRRFHEECKKNGDILITAVVFFRDVLRAVEHLSRTFDDDGEVSGERAAKDIQNALFYQMDLLARFRQVIHSSSAQLSSQALAMLVETVHILLKLLEKHTSASRTFVGQASRRDQEQLIEKRFEFTNWLREWCTEPVVDAYTRLLRTAATNPPAINRYLATMFYRLAVSASTPRAFHRLAFLEVAHSTVRLGNAFSKTHPGLVRVCEGIIAGFVRRLREDRVLLVEALFPYDPSIEDYSLRIEEDNGDSYESNRCEDDEELVLPEGLTPRQQIRSLVRYLVEQEQTVHLHWLTSLLSQQGEAEQTLIVSESESQKRALKLPAMISLLKVLGVRPPTAMLKQWHTKPSEELEGNLGYIRSVVAELLEEEEGGGRLVLPPHPVQSAPLIASDSSSEEDDMSDVDSPKKMKPAQKPIKWKSFMRASFLAAPSEDTDEGDTKNSSALPLAIVEEDYNGDAPKGDYDVPLDKTLGREEIGGSATLVAAGAKRAKTRIIDSDEDD